MVQPQPLWMRLYRDPLCAAVARAIGYVGVPVPDLLKQIEPLEQAHGKPAIQSGFDEIAYIDSGVKPPVAKLKVHVRPLCHQLLGPAPEHPEYAHYQQPKAWVPPWARKDDEPKEATQEGKPKRRRKAS